MILTKEPDWSKWSTWVTSRNKTGTPSTCFYWLAAVSSWFRVLQRVRVIKIIKLRIWPFCLIYDTAVLNFWLKF
jgi:hypothetical protein